VPPGLSDGSQPALAEEQCPLVARCVIVCLRPATGLAQGSVQRMRSAAVYSSIYSNRRPCLQYGK
jgi:hypothetical protein